MIMCGVASIFPYSGTELATQLGCNEHQAYGCFRRSELFRGAVARHWQPVAASAARRRLSHGAGDDATVPAAGGLCRRLRNRLDSEAFAKITSDAFHILVTDWEMPGMNGTELSRRVREVDLAGYVYILLLTGHGSPELAVDALGSGADNFIRKPVNPPELLAHVNAGWRIVQLERSLRSANEHIRQLTVTDALLGTYNRRYLDDELSKEVDRARRYDHRLSAVMVDLDHFKNINDQHGHTVGDEVLREVAGRARAAIRQGSDWIARYGGEEFVIVLPETPLAGAAATAEKIRAILAQTPVGTTAVARCR